MIFLSLFFINNTELDANYKNGLEDYFMEVFENGSKDEQKVCKKRLIQIFNESGNEVKKVLIPYVFLFGVEYDVEGSIYDNKALLRDRLVVLGEKNRIVLIEYLLENIKSYTWDDIDSRDFTRVFVKLNPKTRLIKLYLKKTNFKKDLVYFSVRYGKYFLVEDIVDDIYSYNIEAEDILNGIAENGRRTFYFLYDIYKKLKRKIFILDDNVLFEAIETWKEDGIDIEKDLLVNKVWERIDYLPRFSYLNDYLDKQDFLNILKEARSYDVRSFAAFYYVLKGGSLVDTLKETYRKAYREAVFNVRPMDLDDKELAYLLINGFRYCYKSKLDVLMFLSKSDKQYSNVINNEVAKYVYFDLEDINDFVSKKYGYIYDYPVLLALDILSSVRDTVYSNVLLLNDSCTYYLTHSKRLLKYNYMYFNFVLFKFKIKKNIPVGDRMKELITMMKNRISSINIKR